jgi:hypothetical protein
MQFTNCIFYFRAFYIKILSFCILKNLHDFYLTMTGSHRIKNLLSNQSAFCCTKAWLHF